MLLSSFLISLRLLSPQQREEKVKKNHGVLTLQSIQQNGHAMAVSILDSLGNKTCGIILNMFQCFFSFPLVSLHLHSSVNYTNLSVCARVRAKSLSRVRLFATPGTAARQASLSITHSRSLLRLLSFEWVMLSSEVNALTLISCCITVDLARAVVLFELCL